MAAGSTLQLRMAHKAGRAVGASWEVLKVEARGGGLERCSNLLFSSLTLQLNAILISHTRAHMEKIHYDQSAYCKS